MSSTAGGRDASETALTPDVLDSGVAGRLMLRGSALRSAGYVGGVLLALISAPLLVRHLGVADFGWWVTVTSLVFIVNGLTDLGMTAVGVREYSVRSGEGRASLIRDLVAVRIVASVAGVVIAVGFAVVAGYGQTLVVGTAIVSLSLLANALQTTYSTPLHATLRLGWITALDLVRQVATVGLIAALVLAGADLLPFFAVPVVSGVVALGLTVALVRRGIPMTPSRRLTGARQLVRDTLPYAAATAFGIVYFRVEIIIMSLISSESETGDFAVAFRIVEIAVGIPWLLVSSAFPILARAARDDQARLRYALGRIFEGSLIAGFGIALALGFAASFAISVLGGERASVGVLEILSVALLANFLVAAWVYALLSLHKYRALLVSNASAFAVGIVLTLILVPPYGADGAAVAVALTEFALAGFTLVALVHARRDLRPPLLAGARITLAAAAVAAPLVVLDLPSPVEAVVAVVGLVAMLAVLRALPSEFVDAARRR